MEWAAFIPRNGWLQCLGIAGFYSPEYAFLHTFKKANEKHKISGLLLYCNAHFIEVIEGPDAAVEALYCNIKRDKRHRSVFKLIERSSTHRHFEHWAMGFEIQHPEEYTTLDGFSFYLYQNDSAEHFSVEDRWIFTLLHSFKQTMCRLQVRFHP